MAAKIKLAKIELHLFTFLEKTNKKFTSNWENCQDLNKKQSNFQDCAQSYETIMELIEHNRERKNVSDLLEFYYLEAWLGKIQSQFNHLPQHPANEDAVMRNNKKIEELTKSLTSLN